MQLITRKFNVNEYHKMGETGILTSQDRVELIRGEIIPMSPIGLKHAATVKRLNNLLAIQLQDLAIISVQDPIQLDNYSEPQPDIVLLKPRADFYETQIPKPADVYLIIEVSQSSLNYDQTVKLPLYAENKIPEVWLVNLPEQILEVYRQPQGKCYQKQQKNVQSISPLAFSDILVISQDILG